MNDGIRRYRRADLVRRIHDTNPDIPVERVRQITAGQNNVVLVVNEAWIFRFPRTLEGARALAREAAVLPAMRGHLPVETPHPQVVHFPRGREFEWFMGYPMIPGRPLTRSLGMRLSAASLKTIAGQLADVLDSVHSHPITPILRATLDVEDPVSYWSDLFVRIERHLFPLMRPDARDGVALHFAHYLDWAGRRDISSSLVHGDFGGVNILLAKDRASVRAVIDWSSVAIGDPASDYAAASTIHPRMLEFMQSSHSAMASLLDRVAFYRGTFALQEALFGAEHDDAEALDAGLRPYV